MVSRQATRQDVAEEATKRRLEECCASLCGLSRAALHGRLFGEAQQGSQECKTTRRRRKPARAVPAKCCVHAELRMRGAEYESCAVTVENTCDLHRARPHHVVRVASRGPGNKR